MGPWARTVGLARFFLPAPLGRLSVLLSAWYCYRLGTAIGSVLPRAGYYSYAKKRRTRSREYSAVSSMSPKAMISPA